MQIITPYERTQYFSVDFLFIKPIAIFFPLLLYIDEIDSRVVFFKPTDTDLFKFSHSFPHFNFLQILIILLNQLIINR